LKLKSFRIKNFRSIEDTKCQLADKITVLAGKNESGKTNILDALMTLNDEVEFKESDRPLNKEPDVDVRITFYFELNEDEKKHCLKEFQIDLMDLPNSVVIENSFDEDAPIIYGPFIEKVEKIIAKNFEKEKSLFNDKIRELNKHFQETSMGGTSPIGKIDLATLDQTIIDLKEMETELPRNPQSHQPENPELLKNIQDLSNLINPVIDKLQSVLDRIWEMRPKVVKFSSFDDILPSQVPYAEFTEELLKQNHRIVYDLGKLADIDFNRIQTDDRQIRETLTEEAARITTTKFMKFWKQFPVEFKFRIDEPHVSIFIRDAGKEIPYKPEQRSKGFQWFLSFYLRLEAQANEENNLILIDEPGLYLHARAQKDVLGVLEGEAEKNQIIFTTHSPYLIDPNELNRIRLVLKDEKNEQTVITGSYYKGADADTLTPIVTAIGLDLTRDMIFSKEFNLVLEGISDYYYLRGMIEVLKKSGGYEFPENIALIPCVGNANVGLIVSLLMGLGLKYKVVLDRKSSTRVINRLKKSGLKDDEIILVGITVNDSIEELFDESDREQYKIESESENKAAISRNFYEKVKSGDFIRFSPVTVDNFRDLLDSLKSGLVHVENLEEAIAGIESDLKNIAEGLAVKYSVVLSPEDEKELIEKYANKIKGLPKLSTEKANKIKDQFRVELENELQNLNNG